MCANLNSFNNTDLHSDLLYDGIIQSGASHTKRIILKLRVDARNPVLRALLCFKFTVKKYIYTCIYTYKQIFTSLNVSFSSRFNSNMRLCSCFWFCFCHLFWTNSFSAAQQPCHTDSCTHIHTHSCVCISFIHTFTQLRVCLYVIALQQVPSECACSLHLTANFKPIHIGAEKFFNLLYKNIKKNIIML